MLVAALIAAGAFVAPKVLEAARTWEAGDDPVRLTELRLPAAATEQRIAEEIDEALTKGDADLARSFLDLADAQRVTIDADRRARIRAAAASHEEDAAKGFLDGVTSGTSDTWSGAAGSVAADLSGFSDVRDLWQEGGKWVRDEPYDGVILGLSTAGLALTGVTVASLLPSAGGSLAAKAPVTRGLSLLRAARRAGLLSRELALRLASMAMAAVDKAALREGMAAARVLDLMAVRQAAHNAIRPGALRTILGIGEDMVALEARVGQRGAAQALAAARSAPELSRARRLAEAMGGRTRAALKLLGVGALALGDVFAVLMQAVWLGLGWMVMAALLARRFGMMVGRLV